MIRPPQTAYSVPESAGSYEGNHGLDNTNGRNPDMRAVLYAVGPCEENHDFAHISCSIFFIGSFRVHIYIRGILLYYMHGSKSITKYWNKSDRRLNTKTSTDFAPGVRAGVVEQVDVYNLLCRSVQLQCHANNGTLAHVEAFFRPGVPLQSSAMSRGGIPLAALMAIVSALLFLWSGSAIFRGSSTGRTSLFLQDFITWFTFQSLLRYFISYLSTFTT